MWHFMRPVRCTSTVNIMLPSSVTHHDGVRMQQLGACRRDGVQRPLPDQPRVKHLPHQQTRSNICSLVQDSLYPKESAAVSFADSTAAQSTPLTPRYWHRAPPECQQAESRGDEIEPNQRLQQNEKRTSYTRMSARRSMSGGVPSGLRTWRQPVRNRVHNQGLTHSFGSPTLGLSATSKWL